MSQKLSNVFKDLYKCPVCGHQHELADFQDKDMLANIAMKSVFGNAGWLECTECEQAMHQIYFVPVTTKQLPKILTNLEKLVKGLDPKVHVSEVPTEYHTVAIDDTHHITLAYARELFSFKHC
jgi:hypothetical protein